MCKVDFCTRKSLSVSLNWPQSKCMLASYTVFLINLLNDKVLLKSISWYIFSLLAIRCLCRVVDSKDLSFNYARVHLPLWNEKLARWSVWCLCLKLLYLYSFWGSQQGKHACTGTNTLRYKYIWWSGSCGTKNQYKSNLQFPMLLFAQLKSFSADLLWMSFASN